MQKLILSPHFWIFFQLTIVLNVLIFLGRAKKACREEPGKREGFRSLILGFAFWGSLPWWVMAAGLETGQVKSVIHYFAADPGNPYHLAFFGSVVLIWILGSLWIWRGGAEKLVEHSELFGKRKVSASGIKLQWGLGIVGGCIGIGLMLSGFLAPFAP